MWNSSAPHKPEKQYLDLMFSQGGALDNSLVISSVNLTERLGHLLSSNLVNTTVLTIKLMCDQANFLSLPLDQKARAVDIEIYRHVTEYEEMATRLNALYGFPYESQINDMVEAYANHLEKGLEETIQNVLGTTRESIIQQQEDAFAKHISAFADGEFYSNTDTEQQQELRALSADATSPSNTTGN